MTITGSEWQADRVVPDWFDLIGGLIALLGVFMIMFWPNGGKSIQDT